MFEYLSNNQINRFFCEQRDVVTVKASDGKWKTSSNTSEMMMMITPESLRYDVILAIGDYY